ncbi:tRNA pseudouridine(13) synthase TruD [Candidatus Pacearchaeota archaeon]|nr:tRNA pseudouridine(13) synthase TruD [Candidatus Pacearchaeota archaeon]
MKKISARLKQKTEDFIVEEIGEKWICKISQEFVQPKINLQLEAHDFLWCELEKKNIDHFTAIKTIANFLNTNLYAIGYAGTKDKQAHTSQRISIEKPNIEKLQTFQHSNIILKNFKWNKRKIKMGYLDANHFKITLRDIDKKDAIKITNQIKKTTFFPNYFGPQRFGINQSNIKIGKAILKRNFQKAIQLIQEDKGLPTTNHRVPTAALKHLPKKMLLMYIHAVQSKIFNDIITQALKENLNLEQKGQQTGILAGYKTRFSQGKLGEIEQEILNQHNLTLEDFNIKEIPFLRIKGSFRKAITKIEDLKIEILDDDEFPNSGPTGSCHLRPKKIILEFTLPSGVYATTFLENFFTFA